jgi:hypothetical protein
MDLVPVIINNFRSQTMSLPKLLYVFEEKETNGAPYFVASTDSHEQTEGLVGVYDLRETLQVRHKPQFRRPKTKQWFDK